MCAQCKIAINSSDRWCFFVQSDFVFQAAGCLFNNSCLWIMDLMVIYCTLSNFLSRSKLLINSLIILLPQNEIDFFSVTKRNFLLFFFLTIFNHFTWDSSTSRKWASKTGGLILDDCWLGWFAHDNQLLVRLHHNARKLWEPNAYVNKALVKLYNGKIWDLCFFHVISQSQLIQDFITYIAFQNATSCKIGNFQYVCNVIRVTGFRSNGTRSVHFGIDISIISK